MPEKTRRLLETVATRHRLAVLGTWLVRMILAGAGVYAVMVLCARLFAWLPNEWFTWWTVAVVPAAAIIGALIIHRGIKMSEAARLVDLRMNTKDLYLTAAVMGDGGAMPGEYQPLVTRDAEERAGNIRPQTVVPLDGWPGATRAVAALGLAVALTWLPSYDLFKKEAKEHEVAQRLEQLEQQKKIAAKKAEELKKHNVDAAHARDVELAMEQLKQTFNQMKPEDPKGNADRLKEQKSMVEAKWKELAEKIAEQTKTQSLSRQFGQQNDAKSQQMKDDMQAGKTDSMDQAFKEAKELAQKLANNEGNEAEQQKLKAQLREKLQQMQNAAQGQPGGQEMAKQLAEALQQLQTSNLDDAQQQAMEAVQQQLQLSQQQMQQMMQQARDLKSLEQALDAVQKAQQANGQKSLDGKECQGAKTMADYLEHYKKVMEEQGQSGEGQGEGQGQGQGDGQGNQPGKNGAFGGPGQGKGGKAPENDAAITDYKTEKDRAQVNQGKILMKWKSEELASGGKVDVKERLDAIEKVKQGVSDAIVSEQVPPGYHDVIKKYFNVMENKAKKDAEAAAKAAAPAPEQAPAPGQAPAPEKPADK